MASGWVCSDPDCSVFYSWRMPTSSLVKSNFKFTKDKKPICVKCWKKFKYGFNNGVKYENQSSSPAFEGW